MYCPVRPYVTNLLRCFKCLCYGNAKKFLSWFCYLGSLCRSGHDNKNGEYVETCASCQGNHAAYFRSCTSLIRGKEILTVKITQNLLYHKHV